MTVATPHSAPLPMTAPPLLALGARQSLLARGRRPLGEGGGPGSSCARSSGERPALPGRRSGCTQREEMSHAQAQPRKPEQL